MPRGKACSPTDKPPDWLMRVDYQGLKSYDVYSWGALLGEMQMLDRNLHGRDPSSKGFDWSFEVWQRRRKSGFRRLVPVASRRSPRLAHIPRVGVIPDWAFDFLRPEWEHEREQERLNALIFGPAHMGLPEGDSPRGCTDMGGASLGEAELSVERSLGLAGEPIPEVGPIRRRLAFDAGLEEPPETGGASAFPGSPFALRGLVPLWVDFDLPIEVLLGEFRKFAVANGALSLPKTQGGVEAAEVKGLFDGWLNSRIVLLWDLLFWVRCTQPRDWWPSWDLVGRWMCDQPFGLAYKDIRSALHTSRARLGQALDLAPAVLAQGAIPRQQIHRKPPELS